MSVLIDKSILLLFTIPLLLRESGMVPVIAFLTGFTASCVLSLKDHEKLSLSVSCMYGILSISFPSFELFLPLFCYDCTRTSRKFSGALLVLCSIPFLTSHPLFLRMGLILNLLLSIFLSVRTQKLDGIGKNSKN